MSRQDLFTTTLDHPLIAPSILAADFSRMADDCRGALQAGGDLLHLDVMDGHFVPNLTMGPAMCRDLRAALPDALLDVHLMVTDPAMFVRPFADAGADHLTFHAEVVAPERRSELIQTIREHGMTVGIAINPPTPLEALGESVADVDMVLVMSVNPGFGGQAFIESSLEKMHVMHGRLTATQRLEVDGGVNAETSTACRDAGADVLVAGSAIFRSDNYADAIARLRSIGGVANA